jgi:hypothetical protein
MMDIGINEEATFDYAMRNYSIDHFPKVCMCGAKKCRGKITGWKDLPNEQKKAYEGFVAPYLLEIDAKKVLRPVSQSRIRNGRERSGVLQVSSPAS